MIAAPIGGKLFQAGYVVRDMEAATAAAGERFGVSRWFVKPIPKGGILTAIGFAWVGDFMWEFLEVDADNPPELYRDFIPASRSGARFNHLGYMVGSGEDLRAVMRAYEAAGVGTALHMEMGDVLECYYADTLAELGHYCEYVHLRENGQGYFAGAPQNR